MNTNWKAQRDYRCNRDDNQEILAYIITIGGVDVEVSEAVFKEYSSADRRERYQRETDYKRFLSVEKIADDSNDLELYTGQYVESPEEQMIEKEEEAERQKLLSDLSLVIEQLDSSDRALVQAIYFDGTSEREYARKLGVTHRTVQRRRECVLKKLKIFLQNR